MGDFDSESEDSDNEGGLGNVSRVVMRPPGHSGKAKRGHLCFDAAFETGNLGRVLLVSDFEYDLFIRPDTCNPRLRLWFHFTVDNIRIDQRVIFNIVNFSKKRTLFLNGMTPLVRSHFRNKWQRMPRKNVYYHKSPYHMSNYILTFSFTFDKEEDVYDFSFSYPYSYSKLQAHLEVIERKNFPHFKRELLGKSIQNRRLDILTITHPKNMTAGQQLRVVVIMARIHPGESPSSFVCQGIIDFLVSNHPIAIILREHIVFKIVPMLNPDGVFLGNYRSSLMGLDLNRWWNSISHWLHPTLHSVFSFLSAIDQDKNMELDFVMDIHAHCSLLGVFVYGNTYDDVFRYERHIVFPKLLAQNTDGYESCNTMYNRDVNKAGSSRRVLCDVLKDSVNCYSLIVSYHGYKHPNVPGVHYYTEESYYRLGRNVVRTYLDYYRITGVVPAAEREPRQARPRRRQPRTKSMHSRSVPGHACHSAMPSSREASAHRVALTFRDDAISGEVEGEKRRVHVWMRRRRCRSQPPPARSKTAPPPPQPPRVNIIDFNTLTRGGLELAKKRDRNAPPY
ncbi:hypothetical protein LSTR_LSTR005648 [Laodelphax striatellus]|uniref:Peptidase M14 domain-containing protein n=1 Tax=Laodelphax striatellus TaxID=195883 RepID=A0A482WVH2_LAOST|nr:hypothetical protein LSTR_LSTR005648 [Laodelphax striatellus]